MNKKIAAVGNKESVLGFKAIGIDAFPVEGAEEAKRVVHSLAKQGYAIVFITEQTAEGIPEIMERYAASSYPAIIPIPSNLGSNGLGMRRLKKNVEKALGADILFGKEG